MDGRWAHGTRLFGADTGLSVCQHVRSSKGVLRMRAYIGAPTCEAAIGEGQAA